MDVEIAISLSVYYYPTNERGRKLKLHHSDFERSEIELVNFNFREIEYFNNIINKSTQKLSNRAITVLEKSAAKQLVLPGIKL